MKRSIKGIILMSQLLAMPVYAQQTTSQSQGINLTVYNQNFGLVKDTRQIDLNAGTNQVRFEDVAAQIDPTSVSIQSLTHPNSLVVKEQNYQYDVLNPTTILAKSIGKPIKLRQFVGNGQINDISGILLNSPQVVISDTSGSSVTSSQGLVIKSGESVILNPYGQIELAELPAGLVSKPSLFWRIDTTKPGRHSTEIAYQTSGINWKCDYVAIANQDDNKLDLTSWITLDNRSGASYPSASLKLMAGDVHKVQPPMQKMYMMRGAAADMAEAQVTEQAFAEYHLYTVKGKTDVNQNETKQISLFNASDVPVDKRFVVEATPIFWAMPQENNKQKVQVKMEFQNSKANNLGMPLPKGKVRVYKRDQDGALQFVGEDLIDHTPQDEKVRLYLGDAFDLTAERKQTNFLQVSDRITRLTWEITLRNAKDKAVTISAIETGQGQWKILSSSHPYEKKDWRTFEFKVGVPAHGETKITYQIENKF